MSTWTQSDVDALKAAVSSGVLIVEYEGPPRRKIEYQSLDAMRHLLAEMIAQVGNANGSRSPFYVFGVNKGFE